MVRFRYYVASLGDFARRVKGKIASWTRIRYEDALMANRRSLDEMTPAQCRMARAALKLGVRELAEIAKVSTNTITRFEQDELLRSRTINAIKRALEQYGTIFIDANPNGGPGVRLAPWYSAIFWEVSKKGLTPPRLVSISEEAIRLEFTFRRGKIIVEIDRKALKEGTALFLNDRLTEKIVLSNMSAFAAFIAKTYLANPEEFNSIGDSAKHLSIGEEQLRNNIAIRVRVSPDDETLNSEGRAEVSCRNGGPLHCAPVCRPVDVPATFGRTAGAFDCALVEWRVIGFPACSIKSRGKAPQPPRKSGRHVYDVHRDHAQFVQLLFRRRPRCRASSRQLWRPSIGRHVAEFQFRYNERSTRKRRSKDADQRRAADHSGRDRNRLPSFSGVSCRLFWNR